MAVLLPDGTQLNGMPPMPGAGIVPQAPAPVAFAQPAAAAQPAQAPPDNPEFAPGKGSKLGGILSTLLGWKHREDVAKREDRVRFLQGEIHSALNDPNSRLPREYLDKYVNELSQNLQSGHAPEIGKILKNHVEQVFHSRDIAGKAAQMKAAQPVPQAPPVMGQGPQAPAQPAPSLPAPPAPQDTGQPQAGPQGSAFRPFDDGGPAGGPPPLQNENPATKAAAVQGGVGFGIPAPPAGGSHIMSRAALGAEQGQQAMAEKYPLLEKQAELAQRMQAAIVEEAKSIGLKDPAMIADYVNKHPVSQMLKAGPGDMLYGRDGRVLGTGGPQITNQPEGSSTLITPTGPGGQPGLPSMPGGPSAGPTVIPGPAPRLTPDEALLLSAAQRVAASHGIQFDPQKNPRNPYAQIPTQFHQEVAGLHARDKADPEIRSMRLAMANSMEALRSIQADNARARRSDTSYQQSQRELDAVAKPISDRVERIGRLQDTLAQNSPGADAFVAPEMVTVMAGGAGSGVRVTQSEIDQAVGGRTAYENLKARIDYVANNPGKGYKFTDAQRQQMSRLLKVVADKAVAKQNAVIEAYRGIAGSENPVEHRNILLGLRETHARIDQGNGLPLPPGRIRIKTKDGSSSGTIDEKDFNAATMDKM